MSYWYNFPAMYKNTVQYIVCVIRSILSQKVIGGWRYELWMRLRSNKPNTEKHLIPCSMSRVSNFKYHCHQWWFILFPSVSVNQKDTYLYNGCHCIIIWTIEPGICQKYMTWGGAVMRAHQLKSKYYNVHCKSMKEKLGSLLTSTILRA